VTPICHRCGCEAEFELRKGILDIEFGAYRCPECKEFVKPEQEVEYYE